MKRIEKETDILVSNDKQITLTSHIIRQESKQWGSLQIKSIMLEHFTSCEFIKKSMPLLLIISILSIVFALGVAASNRYGENEEILLSGFVFAVFFLLAYLVTIRKVLIIASPSVKIIMNTSKMKVENIKTFIDELESAKNKRIFING